MRLNQYFLLLGVMSLAGTAQAMDLRSFYQSMRGREVNLSFQDSQGHILLGVSTFEKTEGNVICRRSGAVVPRPVYSYACFVGLASLDSVSLYRNTQGEPVTVVHNDGRQGQTIVREKSGAGYLCQSLEGDGKPAEIQCYALLREGE